MSTTKPIPPTITVHQAARALQVQPATVYTWIRNDEFPHLRLGGRIRIPTARLADLLGITPREVIDGLGVMNPPTDRRG
jgi:excisionase family DNA binding protein